MDILLIDYEASGVDPKVARIYEIGAMIVDENWEPKGPKVSQLVWESGYPAITDEVKAVTGLTQDMLTNEGVPLKQAFTMLGDIISPATRFAVAFNRAYDEVLFKEEICRTGQGDSGLAKLFAMPWLCAMLDIESNYKFKSWRLAHLALEYGVTVNPKELHRAINDVELMRQMLQATGTSAMDMYLYQQIPWVYVAAITKPPWEDQGKSTDMAKARGYSWQVAKGDNSGKTFDKRWIKKIKEKDFNKEEKEAPFTVRIIKE